jgi:hypothetical protein
MGGQGYPQRKKDSSNIFLLKMCASNDIFKVNQEEVEKKQENWKRLISHTKKSKLN